MLETLVAMIVGLTLVVIVQAVSYIRICRSYERRLDEWVAWQERVYATMRGESNG